MYLDIFICVLLLWAVISGWRNGFVKEAFSTVGLIVGLVLAGVAYLCFGEDFLAIKGSDTNMVLSIGAFILLWICLPLFLGLVANILTKAIKGMVPDTVIGRKALTRLRVFKGAEHVHAAQKPEAWEF